MKCSQKDCNTDIIIFAIAGFYHGPHHYRFTRAICPKHGEIPLWPWNWSLNRKTRINYENERKQIWR